MGWFVPAIMAAASYLGSRSKSNKDPKIQTPPESFPGAPQMREDLALAAGPGALERIERSGESYQGPLIAALSEFEETGLGGLKDWLGSDLPTEGKLYTSAADEIQKTLSGDYDPAKSEYYEAYRSGVMRELEEAKDRLAARSSSRDKLFGGGRIAVEGELEESAVGDLAMILGQLSERERERRLGAVPQALELTEFEEAAPVRRIAASQELGALPRILQQAEMDVEYQEWMRSLNDLGIALDTATGLATYSPGTIVTGGGKTELGSIAGALGPLIAALYGQRGSDTGVLAGSGYNWG